MPIKCDIKPVEITKDEYHQLDYKVMGIIFEIHKDLGRLCDGKIYQKQILNLCREAKIAALEEVPIEIYHKNFSKVYYADLIINNRIIYELKTANSISPQHRKQILNYLFLTGFKYGKLVNMRPNSVGSEFINTNISPEIRYKFEIITKDWHDLNSESIWLRNLVSDLIKDWGVYLDFELFYEAIAYFKGGYDNFIKPIDIISEGTTIGIQKMGLLTPEISVHISSIKDSPESQETHLLRLLKHTSLKAIHWINFNRNKITMKTLIKET